MRLYFYISGIILSILLINLWAFYAPSSFELRLGDLLSAHWMPLDSLVVLQVSNTVYSLVFICILFCLYLLWRRDIVGAFTVSLALLALLVIDPLKDLFQRPRPLTDIDVLHSITGFGFPSGHSLLAVVLTGVLYVMLIRHHYLNVNDKKIVYLIVAYTIIIGWTRIRLGVHYLSDVLAGYALGVLLLLMLVWIDAALRMRLYGSSLNKDAQ